MTINITEKRAFLDKASEAAYQAHVPFNVMWACEAALESNFGTSGLAVKDNNLFGMKQHSHPVYGTHNLPTKEFIGGAWITVTAAWVSYPDWTACFQDRLDTLKRLAPAAGFEHYRDALNATDCVTFVKCVSAKWSTDPHRADKVIAIYDAYMGGQ
jgi:flagellum-specific peptidoglycan hydrolase FlgJ